MQLTVTVKVQIITTDEDRVLLDKTMDTYRKACNYVSTYVFRTHDLRQPSLNAALYAALRSRFGLKSQMAMLKRCVTANMIPVGVGSGDSNGKRG